MAWTKIIVIIFITYFQVCSLQGKDVYTDTYNEWRKQVEGLDIEGIEGGCIDEVGTLFIF